MTVDLGQRRHQYPGICGSTALLLQKTNDAHAGARRCLKFDESLDELHACPLHPLRWPSGVREPERPGLDSGKFDREIVFDLLLPHGRLDVPAKADQVSPTAVRCK